MVAVAMTFIPTLAVTSAWIGVLIYGGILIGIILVGGAAIMVFRRKIVTPDDGDPTIGFTLDDLRQLKERGELSDDEYEAARKSMTDLLRQEHELDVSELSLKELRDLLEGEQITPEQFMALRKQVIERMKGRTKE
jgi:hypothetical protein